MCTVDPGERKKLLENIKQGSIITWQHVNMFGLYDFSILKSKNDPDFDVEKANRLYCGMISWPICPGFTL